MLWKILCFFLFVRFIMFLWKYANTIYILFVIYIVCFVSSTISLRNIIFFFFHKTGEVANRPPCQQLCSLVIQSRWHENTTYSRQLFRWPRHCYCFHSLASLLLLSPPTLPHKSDDVMLARSPSSCLPLPPL